MKSVPDISADAAADAAARPRVRDVALDTPPMPVLVEAGQVLRRTGYGTAGVLQLLGTAAGTVLDVSDRVLGLRRLDQRSAAEGLAPVALLARALLFDEPLDVAECEDVLGVRELEVLSAAGLLQRDGEHLYPGVRLVPHEDVSGLDRGDLLVASDPVAAEQRADTVPGVHRPTLTLSEFTPRSPVGSALDLGTGCGFQALQLAGHAKRIVATDVNPRAVGFAGLNIALNDPVVGGTAFDLRVGDLLEPVRGETFDLVVSNPPYVLSPETGRVFKDSGYPGDSFNRLVATRIGDSVTPGGTAVVLLAWSQLPGQPPAPLDWLAASPDDAVLVVTAVSDPLSDAGLWNQDLAAAPDRYGERIDAWLDWYARHGIVGISYGALALRRRRSPDGAQSDPPWRAALSGEDRSGPVGDQLSRMLTGHEQLRHLTDEQLLRARLRLLPGVAVSARTEPGPDGWSRTVEVVRRPGLGLRAPLGADHERCLLTLSVREFTEVADLTSTASGATVPAAGALVRGLVEAGLAELRPAPTP
jgi:hypothetical protein